MLLAERGPAPNDASGTAAGPTAVIALPVLDGGMNSASWSPACGGYGSLGGGT